MTAPAPAPVLSTNWAELHNAQLAEKIRNLPEALRAARAAAIQLSDAKLNLRSSRNDADNRKFARIKNAAVLLPRITQYLRNAYPNELSTADIVDVLGVGETAVRDELGSSRRAKRRDVNTVGLRNHVLWQYSPTAEEPPWSEEYKTDQSVRTDN